MIFFRAQAATLTFRQVDLQEKHFKRNALIVIEIIAFLYQTHMPFPSEPAFVPPSGNL